MQYRFLVLICLSFSAIAQSQPHLKGDAVLHKNLQPWVYGLNFHSGAVRFHNNDVPNAETAKPKGFSFDWAKQFNDSASYAHCRMYIRKGFTFSFYDLGTAAWGNGFMLSYFLQPVYRIGNKFQFQFRGSAGAGYFSNPFDSIKNKNNNNYSLHISPYLHVVAGFGFHITKKLILEGNINFNHVSNGNYKQPNIGLNWSAFSAALFYFPDGNSLPKYGKPPRYRWSEKKAGLDVGLMFVPKQGYHHKRKNTRHYMVGMFASTQKKVSRINAVSAGAELYYNKFSDAPGMAPGNSKPATLAGVYLGNEFLLNKIIFSQEYGRYITHKPAFVKTAYYHRWGMRYRLNKHLHAGFNMKVHKFIADFIDLRLQYKIF